MKNLTIALLLLLVVAVSPAYAAIDAVDPVPAATLLQPYFEVDYSNANGKRTVLTIGTVSASETLTHVTLWTDRGVPVYSFDVRLAAHGSKEIDLFALFRNGTLPQSTPGGFGSCGASLPPAAISPTPLAQLQRAFRGQSSSFLGGNCGGVNYNENIARGYVTIDVTSSCTSEFPGGTGYFVSGGNGIATNNNVLWGEVSVTDPVSVNAHGSPMVHIEADATNPFTDGTPGPDVYCSVYFSYPIVTCPAESITPVPDYTFYSRRTGSNADNREALPMEWLGRYDLTNAKVNFAQVWRDPGNATSFACGNPPAGLTNRLIVAFDHQENVAINGPFPTLPYATQRVRINTAFVPPDFETGLVYYTLALSENQGVLETRNQSYVTHIYEGAGSTGEASAWPSSSPASSRETTNLPIGPPADPQCSDQIDNDGDGLIDFPADPGCRAASTNIENPECNDGISNDADGLIDFPNDPGCHSRSDFLEEDTFVIQCDDGIDNDGDGAIDWPNDGGCYNFSDNSEDSNACNDGFDNDGDGLTDFPADPGCGSASSSIENPQCNDGVSNDADGLIDFPSDPGCASRSSDTESPACNDGVSNDADGLIDFPSDPGCASRSSQNESPQCNDTFENDGDGLIDMNDPGCTSPSDNRELQQECNDGLDNDGDGLIDFPYETGCSSASDDSETANCNNGEDDDCDGTTDAGDPGCANPNDLNEGPGVTLACSDGIDNDGDGFIDFPNDPGCISRADDVEFNDPSVVAAIAEVPALSPLALAFMAALLAIVAAVALRGGMMNG